MTTSAAIDFSTQTAGKRKIRVRRTKAQWKALLEEYATSGLTQAAFCQQHRVAPSGLCKWRKYFANQAAESNSIDITESLAKAAVPFPEPGRGDHWQRGVGTAPRCGAAYAHDLMFFPESKIKIWLYAKPNSRSPTLIAVGSVFAPSGWSKAGSITTKRRVRNRRSVGHN